MNINEHAFGGINTYGGSEKPPSTGLAPESQKLVLTVNLQAVVSAKNICWRLFPKLLSEKLKLLRM